MTSEGHAVAKWNHRNRGQCKDDRDHRRRDVQRPIDVGRRQIFFKEKFHSVGGRLQQSEWAYTSWSPAVLHVADDLALQPNRVGNRSQQHEQDQHDLNERNEDEERYAQFADGFLLQLPCFASFARPQRTLRSKAFNHKVRREKPQRSQRKLTTPIANCAISKCFQSAATSTGSASLFSITAFR